ncbi:uncharacterized protein LOC143582116 [Bidens hawaiensis]|uniref:uncharacterized protein LOC143582116 n=1 Tax=Bidens hawaiensis TaxID=980011 RepID=UPI00404B2E37
MATETKPKMKPRSGIRDSSTPKTKFDSSVIKNRVATIDSKHKIEAKGKSVVTSSKTQTKTTIVKTREKKVYSLPGQKFDVPEEREPLRIFYESLSKQIPTSEMAEFWMMEHGMLSPERARKAFEKKKRKQKEIRVGTPVKSPPPPPSRVESSKRPQQVSSQSRGESSKKPQPVPVSKNGDAKANKRVLNYSYDDEDDLPLSHKRRNM